MATFGVAYVAAWQPVLFESFVEPFAKKPIEAWTLAFAASAKNAWRPAFTGFQRTARFCSPPSLLPMLPERSTMKTREMGGESTPAEDVAHADVGSTPPTAPTWPELPLDP